MLTIETLCIHTGRKVLDKTVLGTTQTGSEVAVLQRPYKWRLWWLGLYCPLIFHTFSQILLLFVSGIDVDSSSFYPSMWLSCRGTSPTETLSDACDDRPLPWNSQLSHHSFLHCTHWSSLYVAIYALIWSTITKYHQFVFDKCQRAMKAPRFGEKLSDLGSSASHEVLTSLFEYSALKRRTNDRNLSRLNSGFKKMLFHSHNAALCGLSGKAIVRPNGPRVDACKGCSYTTTVAWGYVGLGERCACSSRFGVTGLKSVIWTNSTQ